MVPGRRLTEIFTRLLMYSTQRREFLGEQVGPDRCGSVLLGFALTLPLFIRLSNSLGYKLVIFSVHW